MTSYTVDLKAPDFSKAAGTKAGWLAQRGTAHTEGTELYGWGLAGERGRQERAMPSTQAARGATGAEAAAAAGAEVAAAGALGDAAVGRPSRDEP